MRLKPSAALSQVSPLTQHENKPSPQTKTVRANGSAERWRTSIRGACGAGICFVMILWNIYRYDYHGFFIEWHMFLLRHHCDENYQRRRRWLLLFDARIQRMAVALWETLLSIEDIEVYERRRCLWTISLSIGDAGVYGIYRCIWDTVVSLEDIVVYGRRWCLWKIYWCLSETLVSMDDIDVCGRCRRRWKMITDAYGRRWYLWVIAMSMGDVEVYGRYIDEVYGLETLTYIWEAVNRSVLGAAQRTRKKD